MRTSILIVAVIVCVHPVSLLCQSIAPNVYVPPQLTLERLMQNDPTFNGTNMFSLAADPGKLRTTLEQEAASGKLIAQMMLGEAYIPVECTYLPFKTAPADCPQDFAPNDLLGLTRSFDSAVHWLTLASKQGSGEASEILAQVMERAIRSTGGQSRYTMADVVRFHKVARAQGFDLQDVELSCYTLDSSSPDDRLVVADTPPEFQFTPQELASFHAAGASGTIRWSSANSGGMSTLLQHPEGPKVRTRILNGAQVHHERLVPLGDRVDVVYLQQGDAIVTFPATYPVMRRQIMFLPDSASQPGEAVVQAIDGTYTGNGCVSAMPPVDNA